MARAAVALVAVPEAALRVGSLWVGHLGHAHLVGSFIRIKVGARARGLGRK